jgi:CheY-like chemotaxis protein
MKTGNEDQLRQELRLAQLEIKMLREQLLKSVKDAQRSQDQTQEATAPASATALAKSVIVPMLSKKSKPDASTRSKPDPGSNGSPRVLYVEDSEPNFRLVENVLVDRPGTDLIWAETGEQALDVARSQSPQLVLLDLDLPDIHGRRVLQELQAQPETAKIPVIVISADATPSQIERMLTAGARNYLTKPFEIRRFLCMFDEIFAPA